MNLAKMIDEQINRIERGNDVDRARLEAFSTLSRDSIAGYVEIATKGLEESIVRNSRQIKKMRKMYHIHS